MEVTTETMTDEQRKSVALEYLKAFDNGGVPVPAAASSTCSPTTPRSTSRSGVSPTARRRSASCSATSAATLSRSCTTTRVQLGLLQRRHWSSARGPATASTRMARGGPVPEWAAGRWCDVFEIRDFLIQRCFIYLDPDYAGKDTERYPWLNKPQ